MPLRLSPDSVPTLSANDSFGATYPRILHRLNRRLPRTLTVDDAAEVVCGELVRKSLGMPSIFLMRSGRLRRYASRGFVDVRDGFLPHSGILGQAFRSGKPVIADNTTHVYEPSSADAAHLLCAPIYSDGVVVGVLRLESVEALPVETIDLLMHITASFGEHIASIGGLRPAVGWQLLADSASALIATRCIEEVYAHCLRLATSVCPAHSAMLIFDDQDKNPTVVASTGPISEWARTATAERLRFLRRFVGSNRSGYRLSDQTGERLWASANDAVDTAEFLLVTQVNADAIGQGLLCIVGDDSVVAAPELIEQIELLGALVAGALATATSISTLEQEAHLDPLTGLANRRTFRKLLDTPTGRTGNVAICVIDVDNFKQVNDTFGHEAGDDALIALTRAIVNTLRAEDQVFRIGGDEFVAVTHADDREGAGQAAERIVAAVQAVGLGVSIGVALADKSAGIADAYRSADAALLGVKRSGRNGYAIVS